MEGVLEQRELYRPYLMKIIIGQQSLKNKEVVKQRFHFTKSNQKQDPTYLELFLSLQAHHKNADPTRHTVDSPSSAHTLIRPSDRGRDRQPVRTTHTRHHTHTPNSAKKRRQEKAPIPKESQNNRRPVLCDKQPPWNKWPTSAFDVNSALGGNAHVKRTRAS